MNRNVTSLILIIVGIGIYFTVTSSMLADAKAVKATNDRYAVALESAAHLVSLRDDIQRQYNAISPADRDRLDKIVPSSVDNIRLIIDVNSVAVKHGFSLSDIKAVASSNGSKTVPSTAPGVAAASPISVPTLDTVSLSFSATASYNQFVSFLQDLETSLRIMDMSHLTITAADTDSYKYDVTLQTYWVRQ